MEYVLPYAVYRLPAIVSIKGTNFGIKTRHKLRGGFCKNCLPAELHALSGDNGDRRNFDPCIAHGCFRNLAFPEWNFLIAPYRTTCFSISIQVLRGTRDMFSACQKWMLNLALKDRYRHHYIIALLDHNVTWNFRTWHSDQHHLRTVKHRICENQLHLDFDGTGSGIPCLPLGLGSKNSDRHSRHCANDNGFWRTAVWKGICYPNRRLPDIGDAFRFKFSIYRDLYIPSM